MSDSAEEKRVFIFLHTMPQRQGNGASLRFYSNICAYLDLGFKVEVIQIGDDGSQPSQDLRPVVWSRINTPIPPPSLRGRLMFRLGVPTKSAIQYYSPGYYTLRRKVNSLRLKFPEAIYQFEFDPLYSTVPWRPGAKRFVWSLHDLYSTVAESSVRISLETQHRAITTTEQRELRFVRQMERYMARHIPLILCIAKHDCERLRSEWGCSHAEYFPMSIPGDGAERSAGTWMPDGRLRLLHLGRVSHLPSYRSLESLFEQVFPRLSREVLQRITVDVVGQVDQGDQRADKILALAAPYPNVLFHGFVDDVVPYYRNSDLQVVASTDASGLRTRIIESFAYGLPVLSTRVGARGVGGLRADEHLLLADDAAQFAESLSRLVQEPETLTALSRNGREFYRLNHSRAAVASSLARHLSQYLGVIC